MTTKGKKQDWRSLCELITHESDPKRLSELADRLLKELDAREQTVSKNNGKKNNGRRKPASGSATARKSRK